MAIGGLDQAFLCVMAESSASPLNVNSDWPWNRGILTFCESEYRHIRYLYSQLQYTYFQMIQFSDGAYLALPPAPTLTSTLAELSGVGILRITLCA